MFSFILYIQERIWRTSLTFRAFHVIVIAVVVVVFALDYLDGECYLSQWKRHCREKDDVTFTNICLNIHTHTRMYYIFIYYTALSHFKTWIQFTNLYKKKKNVGNLQLQKNLWSLSIRFRVHYTNKQLKGKK